MAETADNNQEATVKAQTDNGGTLILDFEGELSTKTVPGLWKQVHQHLRHAQYKSILINAQGIQHCDAAGLALLFEIQLDTKRQNREFQIHGLKSQFKSLLDMFKPRDFQDIIVEKPKPLGICEQVGRRAIKLNKDVTEQLVFLGRLCATLAHNLAHPREIRWKDVFLTAELAGVNAMGIIVLLGFLFGLIMAFSSAMPLREFGADIYVSDLVAIAMIRVFGPFVTAIVLAGRSSSAFAAEIGTMKINDELNALKTMGIDPVSFLVVPRVIATVVMAPLLAILANVAGLVGSAIVVVSLGFPLVTYVNHVRSFIDYGDVFSGLAKCFVFGWVVGEVGCLRGMQTKSGPSAVGISTTRAVVTSIIWIVVAEGIFAVLYYCLDI